MEWNRSVSATSSGVYSPSCIDQSNREHVENARELLRELMFSVIDVAIAAPVSSSQARIREELLFVSVHFHEAILGAELDAGRIRF
jgi:hypothetical protein